MEPHEFSIKRYSSTELAEFYRVSARTMQRWIKPIKASIGKKLGHFYSTIQVQKIVDHLGMPAWIFGFFWWTGFDQFTDEELTSFFGSDQYIGDYITDEQMIDYVMANNDQTDNGFTDIFN